MNLIEKFRQSFDQNLAAPSCIVGDQVMNRLDFVHLVCLAAMNLHRLGVREGDVVGLTMPHAPLHLATILAVSRLGAVSIPLHPFLPPDKRTSVMERFGVTTVVAAKQEAFAAGERATFVLASELVKPVQGKLSLDFIDYQPSDELPGRFNLTSGTTGMSNAVCYTQRDWVRRIERSSVACNASTRMLPGTLHLTLGNIAAFAALFSGGSVIFQKLGDQAALWRAIWTHNITHAIVTPADLLAITGQLQLDGIAFPSLQQLRVVGGALPDRLYALTRRKVTPHIALPYGTTETSLISWADASDLERFPNSCGKLMPGVELQAMSAQDEPLPVGESGELRVKVPGMACEYVNNPERSHEKFKDGWFYTGDVGMISAEGYVYIQGRTDTRINMAGIKFFPEEVEAMLERHPKVKAAGVFLADSGPEQENRLIAAIVPIDKADPPRDLSHHCQQSQLGLMTPSAFLLVSELPMNLSAKLDRAAMARLFNPLVAP